MNVTRNDVSILEQVQKNYVELLEKYNFCDKITSKSYMYIDEEFVKSCGEITLHVDGILSEFEWSVFEQISQITTIHVLFENLPYNQKLSERFGTLPLFHKIKLELKSREFVATPLAKSTANITLSHFPIASLEVAFVFSKIEEFLQRGLKAQEIVVVLPNENMSDLLSLYDEKNLLNFAMGFSKKRTNFYQKIEAIGEFLAKHSHQNKERIQRLQIDSQVLLSWQKIWSVNVSYEEFTQMLIQIDPDEELEESLVGIKEVFTLLEKVKFYQLFYLFKSAYLKTKLDDNNGGPVRVMGVLETRGVSYKGVILVDFNDEFVPKKSDKDLFLSSKLRAFANLPTPKDRENLQKKYYYMLINNSKECAISYVQNEQMSATRLLSAFEYKMQEYDNEISTLLMSKIKMDFKTLQIVHVEHKPFETELSATRLKSLLQCKRQYYYKYILKLKEHNIPTDEPKPNDIGAFVHEVLQRSFEQGGDFETNVNHFVSVCGHKGVYWDVKKEFWRQKLLEYPQWGADERWVPFLFEQSLACDFCGIRLIGNIDRIDKNENNELRVVDYKSGTNSKSGSKKIESMSDFQMQFYHLLAKKLGEVAEVSYHIFGSKKVEVEKDMPEKIARLEELIEQNRTISDFELCEDFKTCTFCPYKMLCQRD